MMHLSINRMIALSIVFLNSTLVFAQVRIIQPAPAYQSQATVHPMGQTLQWLWGPQMEKELDIVPEQREELTKLRSDVMGKIRTLYDMSIEDPQERMKKYQEAATTLGEETEKKVQEILLPHQVKRIKQIALQMQLQNAGYGGSGLANGSLASELKITDEQKAQMQEKQKEIIKENQEKTQAFYKQLQEESREKLLSVLTPEQRKKLDELIGDKFQWQPYQQPAVLPTR
jgi:Spy/CpxP family protein refolding chaperone